jgi:hypothetical protein
MKFLLHRAMGFRAAVGALVPDGVSLAPGPATIAELMPQTNGLLSAIGAHPRAQAPSDARRSRSVTLQYGSILHATIGIAVRGKAIPRVASLP